jgi:hypothetical protein
MKKIKTKKKKQNKKGKRQKEEGKQTTYFAISFFSLQCLERDD